ncbi:Hint domain-containing protein [Alloyangia pacifica]|uniref:Hint domain-containing protein n=1 Tax=Alloyangia pacifica TaxID=311180 RepID=A0A1I6WL43_9RHOB|nr:Hint domain-containing protein [Alloyangia pacifica]SFT26693.1 Hint domain-containing protein [Alloyangia pacifica]
MEPKTVRRDDGGLPARQIDSVHGDGPVLNALVAGTRVLTLEGALPVEYLSPGDRVITRDGGVATLTCAQRLKRRLPLVAIRAGSLGNARPEGEALLPAAQQILLRDWRASALFGASQALVPLDRLTDGYFVRAAGCHSVQLVALSFTAAHIIYCDGLELASARPVIPPTRPSAHPDRPTA